MDCHNLGHSIRHMLKINPEFTNFFSDNIDVKPDILLPKSEANSDSELLFEDTGFEIENDDIKGDFKCFVCEKLFETANQLSSHGCANKSQKENSQSQQISSDQEEKCLKTYTNQNGSKNNRKRKVQIVKTKSETDPIIQSCPECNMKFRTNQKLRYGFCNCDLMNSGTLLTLKLAGYWDVFFQRNESARWR